MCLIDPVHSNEPEILKAEGYLQKYAIIFKCSHEKLGTKLNVTGTTIPCQSAGDARHDYAPHACMTHVFDWLLKDTTVSEDVDDTHIAGHVLTEEGYDMHKIETSEKETEVKNTTNCQIGFQSFNVISLYLMFHFISLL